MRAFLWILGAGLAALASGSQAAGDAPAAEPVPGSPWHGRVLLGAPSTASAVLGDRAARAQATPFSVLGDYYFGRAWIPTGQAGGLRATSGLVFGPRVPFGLGQAARATSAPVSVGRSPLGPSMSLPGDREVMATVPYLGLGYTAWSARSGWSYSADLGLSGNNGLRLGRNQLNAASLDDAIRDLKMAPLVQVGVSYSF